MRKLSGTMVVNGITVRFDGESVDGRSTPLVTCPKCGLERRLSHRSFQILRHGGTGLCKECGSRVQAKAVSGRIRRTDDQVLQSGSIIHWSQRDPQNHRRVMVTCGLCGKTRLTSVMQSTRWTGYCSDHPRRGKDHQGWKGGRLEDKDGYILVHLSTLDETDKHLAEPMKVYGVYVLEHRLAMARMIGHPLDRGDIVHHINGDKADNRPSNLRLVTRDGHPAENKLTVDTLKAEIARLQAILDERGIKY